ncbi:MAG: hypothetical protein ACXWJW_05110 [Xanthobacteraceae bacterium]
MTLGLSLENFTILHVVISLVQLVSGLVVVWGLTISRSNSAWTAIYLVSAVLTCITGFMFPVTGFLPSHAVGILSLILLALAIIALYGKHLVGAWRWVYAISIVISVYFSAFVTVVQSFLKVPSLHALAPTGSGPPFSITQGVVLFLFVVAGIGAVRRFHPQVGAHGAFAR